MTFEIGDRVSYRLCDSVWERAGKIVGTDGRAFLIHPEGERWSDRPDWVDRMHANELTPANLTPGKTDQPDEVPF